MCNVSVAIFAGLMYNTVYDEWGLWRRWFERKDALVVVFGYQGVACYVEMPLVKF